MIEHTAEYPDYCGGGAKTSQDTKNTNSKI